MGEGADMEGWGLLEWQGTDMGDVKDLTWVNIWV